MEVKLASSRVKMSQRVFTFPFLFFLAVLLLSISVWYTSESSTDHNDDEHLRIRREGRIMMTRSVSVKCPKPHFVLVHGFGGGAWNWYKIRTLLETYGYKVTCLDLKSAGIDRTEHCKIHTFEAYNKPLLNFMANLSDHEKVILVGHSAGGLSVTDASHRFGKKIGVAVYVAATMLKHGYMTDQDRKDGAPEGALRSLINYKCGLEYHQLSTTRKGRNLSGQQINHNTGPQEEAVLGGMLFRPGPLKAVLEARFKGDGADNVRRVYIKTKYDQALTPEQQNAMIKKWPPSESYLVESDHNPLSSDPFVLSGLLVKAAAYIECN